VALVGVVDDHMDRQSLLTATLFGLGCRILPVDCQVDRGGAIAGQIRAGSPDVVFWQLGAMHDASCEPLLSMLASGGLADVAVVVVSRAPADTADVLGPYPVHILASPFTAVALMHVVGEAMASRPHVHPVVSTAT
jgi:hypothetical protein